MKKTLKLAGLLLALVMVVSMMSVTAFAGSITVTPPTGADTLTDSEEVYHAWQMLAIESYTGDTDATTADPASLTGATYVVDDDWYDFFENYEVGDPATAAFVITHNDAENIDYVTLADGVTLSDTDMAALAKAALAYANTNSIAATATSDEGVIDSLDDGWYLVDSSIGAVCMISNVAPDVAINDKNTVPTITKTIADTDEDVAINDEVEFTITVGAKDGGKNYVVTDTMSKGLTFNDDVEISDGTDELTEDEDFTVASSTDSSTGVTTITITLPDPVADGTYTITYTATVNEDAVDEDCENVQQTNSAVLTYGNNSTTESSNVDLDLTQFDVVKVDENGVYLTGAKFKLYAGSTEIPVICIDEDDNIYRPAVSGETADEITAGKARVVGLDADLTYTLAETKQPDGYNKLDGNTDAMTFGACSTYDSITTGSSDLDEVSDINVVENKKGAVLPETGGMGTTLFIVGGAVLMIAAGVLLIAKKRMAAK